MIMIENRKITIPEAERTIGCAGDNRTTSMKFCLLDQLNANYTFKLDILHTDGSTDIVDVKKSREGEKTYLTWTIEKQQIPIEETLYVQIRAFSDSGEIWHTNMLMLLVENAINAQNKIAEPLPSEFEQMEKRITDLKDVTLEKSGLAIDSAAKAEASAEAAGQSEINAQAYEASATEAQRGAIAAKAEADILQIQTANSADLADKAKTAAQTSQAAAAQSESNAKAGKEAAEKAFQYAAQQAEAAKAAATSAQQIANGFCGYTKTETDDLFAKAFIGEKSGKSVTADDVQAGTRFSSVLISGQTNESGSGDKSPDNPYTVTGTSSATVSNDAGTSQTYALPRTLYSLSNSIYDTLDLVGGSYTQRINKIIFDQSTDIYIDNKVGSVQYFYASAKGMGGSILISDKLPCLPKGENECITLSGAAFIEIGIRTARLNGWSDSLTSADKISLFAAWLAQNPVTVWYALPNAVQSSLPVQQIPACSPRSQLTVNSGCVTVKYCRDSNAVLKKLENAITALGGAIL